MAEIIDQKTWVKGIMALYILRILEREPAHGNKMAEEIKRRTCDVINPNSNLLYPLLRKMEERGYVEGGWDHPEKRSKRIYSITEAGRAFLPELEQRVAGRFSEMELRIHILRKDLFGVK